MTDIHAILHVDNKTIAIKLPVQLYLSIKVWGAKSA